MINNITLFIHDEKDDILLSFSSRNEPVLFNIYLALDFQDEIEIGEQKFFILKKTYESSHHNMRIYVERVVIKNEQKPHAAPKI